MALTTPLEGVTSDVNLTSPEPEESYQPTCTAHSVLLGFYYQNTRWWGHLPFPRGLVVCAHHKSRGYLHLDFSVWG